ncbi:hypothetical protein C0991_006553 [Blastosporella zonata]|nr:hypothetical protein C0991_006553 [Blastosporella zonata]
MHCQREQWPIHIFECKTNQPIKTSYYLARAARENTLPDDIQTFKDYGFWRAISVAERLRLLDMYHDLFVTIKVNPKDVNSWLVKGALAKEIKAAYESVPAQARGDSYSWFLANQHIFKGPVSFPVVDMNHAEDILIRSWRFTGGSKKDSMEDIQKKLAQMSPSRRSCHGLYTSLLMRPMSHPPPTLDAWVEFGFCTCRTELSEGQLGGMYHQLIEYECTFQEFVAAYESGQLMKLIDERCFFRDPRNRTIRQGFPYLEDVLANPSLIKPVWYLRQMVDIPAEELEALKIGPYPHLLLDYGFMNCKDDAETQELRNVYKKVLDTPDASPLDLHEACMKGKLFDFVHKFVPMKKKDTRKQLRRLLQNPYPLPG